MYAAKNGRVSPAASTDTEGEAVEEPGPSSGTRAKTDPTTVPEPSGSSQIFTFIVSNADNDGKYVLTMKVNMYCYTTLPNL